MSEDKEKLEITEEKEEEIQNPCAGCDEEVTGCSGCGGRERADTWWYVIALLAILALAIFLRSRGGT
jgi:hypothetical protein